MNIKIGATYVFRGKGKSRSRLELNISQGLYEDVPVNKRVQVLEIVPNQVSPEQPAFIKVKFEGMLRNMTYKDFTYVVADELKSITNRNLPSWF